MFALVFQSRSISSPYLCVFILIIDDLKLLHPLLDSPLVEPQTNFYGELCHVEVQCLLLFFQIKPYVAGPDEARNGGDFKGGQA